jgi:hypothetical protein
MQERRCEYRVLVGKPEGKWLTVRHTCKWEDNITVVQEKSVGVWTGSIWFRTRI